MRGQTRIYTELGSRKKLREGQEGVKIYNFKYIHIDI